MSKKSQISRRFDDTIDEFKLENKLTRYDVMQFCEAYILNSYSNEKSKFRPKFTKHNSN